MQIIFSERQFENKRLFGCFREILIEAE